MDMQIPAVPNPESGHQLVCTGLHGNPPNNYWDLSLNATTVHLMVGLVERSGQSSNWDICTWTKEVSCLTDSKHSFKHSSESRWSVLADNK